jgi:chaperonin cofactor prefoldin
MNADQEIRYLLGDAVVQAVALKHHVQELSKQLADAKARIAELEKSDG